MNVLKHDKQEMVLRLLVEGNSIRGTERITGVHRDTIVRLLQRVGANCQRIMDERMKSLTCQYIEADEIWTYIGKKQMRLSDNEHGTELGDQYVYVALDRDTKLVPAFLVAKRTAESTHSFMELLRERITNKFQLSTDQYVGYFNAVDSVFGLDINYATIRKCYHGERGGREGYSPKRLKKVIIDKILGRPRQDKISTSYVERQNLTIRIHMRRFTRLTNAFSKKLESLKAAVALHFWHYNFMRIHTTIGMTPAMAAGISPGFARWEDVLCNDIN